MCKGKTNCTCCRHDGPRLKLQLASSEVRAVRYQGRDHIVVPVIMAQDDVVMNDYLYPSEEFHPESWNGVPVTVQHPSKNGTHVTANDPHILEEYSIGRIFNARDEDGKLKAEAWIDVKLANQIAPGLVDSLLQGEPLDVSTGFFSDTEATTGEVKGRKYDGIHRNVRPDHLAFLPGVEGACNWADGCGVRANYDDSEPRDDQGQWTDGGGAVAAGLHESTPPTNEGGAPRSAVAMYDRRTGKYSPNIYGSKEEALKSFGGKGAKLEGSGDTYRVRNKMGKLTSTEIRHVKVTGHDISTLPKHLSRKGDDQIVQYSLIHYRGQAPVRNQKVATMNAKFTAALEAVKNALRAFSEAAALEIVDNARSSTDDYRQQIADLVSSDASPFTAEDMSSMSGLSGDTLKRLHDQYCSDMSSNAATTETEMKPEEIAALVKETVTASVAEALKTFAAPQLSAEDKAALTSAKAIVADKREKLIAEVVANSKMTKEQAAAMPDATLEVFLAALPKAPVPTYMGRAMPVGNADDPVAKDMATTGVVAAFKARGAKKKEAA